MGYGFHITVYMLQCVVMTHVNNVLHLCVAFSYLYLL